MAGHGIKDMPDNSNASVDTIPLGFAFSFSFFLFPQVEKKV